MEDRSKLTLRPYQQSCIDICNGLEGGSHLIQMATGLGKTVTFANIERKGRVLILAHRKEILTQAQSYYDVPVGLEMAENKSHGEEVVAASVMSLVQRLNKFPKDAFDMIITDEAHHAVAPSYQKIYDYFQPRLHLGFTATPTRGDKVRLTDIFDDIIFERSIEWGIKNHYLADIDCHQVVVDYNPKSIKTNRDNNTGGVDFQVGALDAAVNTPKTNEQFVKAYNEHAEGQTLLFAASVEHAYNLAEMIPGAQVVEGKTPAKVRDELIEGFRKKEFPCLINNLVLTEGTDIPGVDTVFIARPTKNVSLYTQMVGRGLRLDGDKKLMHLIDCVGIASDCDLCTAPTLLGLDPEKLSLGKRKSASEGLLSTMEDRFLAFDNTASQWALRYRKMNVLSGRITLRGGEKEETYSTNNVRWHDLVNGTFSVSTKLFKLVVSAPDVLGQSTLSVYDKPTGILVYKYDPETTQEALDRGGDFLRRNAEDERPLWSAAHVKRWADKPASQKQIDFARKLCDEEEYKELLEEVDGQMTKGIAGYIIDNGLARKEERTGVKDLAPASAYEISIVRRLAERHKIPLYLAKRMDYDSLTHNDVRRIIDAADKKKWESTY